MTALFIYLATVTVLSIGFMVFCFIRLSKVSRKVTELAAEDKLLRERAERTSETENLRKEFLQMIGHDVRTPLTSLQTVLAMLSKGSYGDLNEKGKERVQQAEQSLFYVIGLINQLFEIDKLSSEEELLLDFSSADIKMTCEQALQIVRPFADLKQINLQLDSESLEIEADHGRISQVILNLVSNAVKHAPDTSTIKISTDKTVDSVNVRISDEGPGLERDLREKAFDRGTQFGEADGGMGLGLAISKAIIEAHQGGIGFESQFGRGACVWFRLPLSRS